MGALTSNKPKNWTDDQNAVWQSVEDHWDHLINKRVEKFIKYIQIGMSNCIKKTLLINGEFIISTKINTLRIIA